MMTQFTCLKYPFKSKTQSIKGITDYPVNRIAETDSYQWAVNDWAQSPQMSSTHTAVPELQALHVQGG